MVTRTAYRRRHLLWGSQFQGVRVHDHHDRGVWQPTGTVLEEVSELTSQPTSTRQKEFIRICMDFCDSLHGLLKPQSWSGITPPTRSHLLILPKQLHQQRTKHSNIWVYGGILLQIPTVSLGKDFPCSWFHSKLWESIKPSLPNTFMFWKIIHPCVEILLGRYRDRNRKVS